MVPNAYIPSFVARIFGRYTEPGTMEALSTTPTATHTFVPSPTTTLPTPTMQTPPFFSDLLSAIYPTVSTTIYTLLKEIATTADTILVLFLGFALAVLILYTVCATANIVLTRFGRGDTLSRMVARMLGEWMAGIKAAWEEGRAVGAGEECDEDAGAGFRRGGWTRTKSEKTALGRPEERLFGGEMFGRDMRKVGIMALAKCEVSVGDKKELQGSELMDGAELMENHWGEKRV